MIRLAARLLVRVVLPFLLWILLCFFLFLISGRIILGGIDVREVQFQLTQLKFEFL